MELLRRASRACVHSSTGVEESEPPEQRAEGYIHQILVEIIELRDHVMELEGALAESFRMERDVELIRTEVESIFIPKKKRYRGEEP